MQCAVALALLAQAADVDAPPASGSAFLYILIGIVVTAVVALVGHGYWVYRRSHGVLRSSDKDVEELVARDEGRAPEDERHDRPA